MSKEIRLSTLKKLTNIENAILRTADLSASIRQLRLQIVKAKSQEDFLTDTSLTERALLQDFLDNTSNF